MDPNALLEAIRRWDGIDPEELKEMFQNLDAWLSKGGFLPEGWNRPPLRAEPPKEKFIIITKAHWDRLPMETRVSIAKNCMEPL